MVKEATSACIASSGEVNTALTVELLSGPISYEAAINNDVNVIHEADYVPLTTALYKQLWQERCTIEDLTKHHLSLINQDVCIVAHPSHWIRGSFNICIPIDVQSPNLCRKLMLRCAMPYKLAEVQNPGSVNEKMEGEVGAYIWMQENCPDICIPYLYGFGFSDHRHVCRTISLLMYPKH